MTSNHNNTNKKKEYISNEFFTPPNVISTDMVDFDYLVGEKDIETNLDEDSTLEDMKYSEDHSEEIRHHEYVEQVELSREILSKVLTDVQFKVYVLRYICSMSFKEVARQMNFTSTGTVSGVLAQIKQKIKRYKETHPDL